MANTSSETGKISRPYHKFAIVKFVARKHNTKTLIKNITNTLDSNKHICFQNQTLFYKASLHAAVRRRDKNPRYLNNNHKNYHTLNSKPSKLQPLMKDISCRTRMTGQGKGAARSLTDDPDFVMLETSSPTQGQKRTGGTRTSSEKKRNKETAEKRGKSTPKKKY